jgi:hypothetical protein
VSRSVAEVGAGGITFEEYAQAADGPSMRRLPVLLLTAALTVPATTMLPTVRVGAAHPAPVRSSIVQLPLAGVDAAALAAPDNGGGAARSASSGQDAVGPLASLPRRVLAADQGGGARTVVLTPARRTASFSTVGVTWDLPATGTQPHPVVVIRTQGAHGWSGWTSLDTDNAGVRDGSGLPAQRGGTDPTWVGPSDGVQVRVDVSDGPAPTGVRVELVEPGTSAYDGEVGATPPGSAAAEATQPTIYSRAQWGADESRVRSAPLIMSGIAAAVIHHTTDTNSYSAAQVPAMIRADYAYHLSLGWNDIGYNFLVDRFGRIWEGRRGGIAAAVQGAHAGGFNDQTFGVAVIGNEQTATPTSATISALERLIAWKLDLAHDDPLGTTVLTADSYSGARWPAGTRVRVPVIMGHRDLDYTACPGAKLYPYLSRIRSGAAALMHAAVVAAAMSASTGPAGRPGPTVTGRVLQSQSWRLIVSDCNADTYFSHVDGSATARTVLRTQWDGRRSGQWANPGVYDLAISSRNWVSWARQVGWSYVVAAPPPGPAPVGAPVAGSGGLVPIEPVRLLDSRTGPALATGPGGRVDVTVTGRGGIPDTGVLAVVLQVTALCPSQSTTLTGWPAGQATPTAVNLMVPARGARTTTVVVPVGAQGLVSIGNAAGVTGLLVDAVGYTVAGGTPVGAVADTRILDGKGAGALPAGGSRTVALPVIAGVDPSRVEAVVAQVRLRGATKAGSVSISGAGEPATAAATARYEAGADTVTLAVLRPVQGRLVVADTGTPVAVTIDVIGLASGDLGVSGQITAVSPTRLYGSGSAGPGGALAAGTTRRLDLTGGGSPVPPGASAVLVSLSATAGAVAATATIRASGSTPPPRADLALGPGGSNANLVLAPLGPDGSVDLTTEGGLRSFAVDVVGYVG